MFVVRLEYDHMHDTLSSPAQMMSQLYWYACNLLGAGGETAVLNTYHVMMVERALKGDDQTTTLSLASISTI